MKIIFIIFSILISIIGAYFVYGIFAMQLGGMIKIKRETGLSLKSQLSVSLGNLIKRIKK